MSKQDQQQVAQEAVELRALSQRRPYRKPTLTVVGDMKTLTAAGSLVGQESFDDPLHPRP